MGTIFSWLALLFAIGLAFLPDRGFAATSAYAQTLEELDLNRVQLVISAPPDVTSLLARRATAIFTKAGLPLIQSDRPHIPFIATLTLNLTPQSSADTCPGHLFYAPSLALTEPVIIPRNSVIITDTTWLAHTGTQVRTPVAVEELERDLDGFIDQFIADYRAANPGGPAFLPGAPPAPIPAHANQTSALNALPLDHLQISVSAGQFTRPLTARAIQQFTTAGHPISTGTHRKGQLTLGIELIQQPLTNQCPEKVLYESGLFLVEQVQLKRNPRVSIWSDTWLRESRQIVSPRSQEQLESDQDALLQQFLDSLTTQ